MNIIICGAGRVGFSISKQLSAQGHSITVVDQSSEFIQKINDTQDVKGVVGRATFPSVLEKAGAKETDMIIAVTYADEVNMVLQTCIDCIASETDCAEALDDIYDEDWDDEYYEEELIIILMIENRLIF